MSARTTTGLMVLLLAALGGCESRIVQFGNVADAAQSGDAQHADAQHADALHADAPHLDAATPDALTPDAHLLDAHLLDAHVFDAHPADAHVIDAGSACSQKPVALGAAATFAVLAASTVTNAGPTLLMGDLGVSPGTAITGFPPGTLTGSIHAGDAPAATASAAVSTAFTDAAGRTLCPTLVAGNLGGMTLTPGLYTSTSSLEISSGDLTLDAQGDSTAIFLFQTASTLTTTPGRHVILANGANAANIYWAVGSSATFGTTSVFQGTVLAAQSITLDTGASLIGRALARTGAVALDTNTVVTPP